MTRQGLAWSALVFAVVALAAGCDKKSTPATSPTTAPTTLPSGVPTPTYALAGPSASVTIATTATPTPIALADYQGITVSGIQFQEATAGGGTLVVSDAVNGADGVTTPDVTPNTLPTDNATAGFTPILYLSLFNETANAMVFGTTTPAISLGSLTVLASHTTCELDAYTENGGTTLTWGSTGASGTVNQANGTVTIPATTIPGGHTLTLAAGQTMVAVSCE